MKFGLSSVTIAIVVTSSATRVDGGVSASASSNGRKLMGLEGRVCVDNQWSVEANGCNFQALLDAEGTTEQCIRKIVGGNTERKLARLCQAAFDNSAMSFENIFPEQDSQWYKEYFDGNTRLNTEQETRDADGALINNLKTKAARIAAIHEDVAQSRGIKFPHNLPTFDMNSCQLRAAMCCFMQDRQDDEHGTCKTGNCINADPVNNADVCYVDVDRAPDSPHLADGFALYPGDIEGATYCRGMAWTGDPTEVGTMFRGNNLFHISFYDSLYQKGYVRNVPLAPMCGCVEKMPTVSRADCTEVVAADQVVRFDFENGQLNATMVSVNLEYRDCPGITAESRNNDLREYYKYLVGRRKADIRDLESLVSKYIVGDDQCELQTNDFIRTKGFETTQI